MQEATQPTDVQPKHDKIMQNGVKIWRASGTCGCSRNHVGLGKKKGQATANLAKSISQCYCLSDRAKDTAKVAV